MNQSEIYHGLQIHADKHEFWMMTPSGSIEHADTIKELRLIVDAIQAALSASSRHGSIVSLMPRTVRKMAGLPAPKRKRGRPRKVKP